MTNLKTKQLPTINVGTIGHVAHGKSTLVYQITGIKTQRHSNELKKNITIKLGYANALIYQCNHCEEYSATGQMREGKIECPYCDEEPSLTVIRRISFVDCPGHEVLMSTMLSGASVMDAAILMIAYKEGKNQLEAQTMEHLAAMDSLGMKNLIIAQNKIDLAGTQEAAMAHYELIREETNDFKIARKAVVIPMCAQTGLNLDILIKLLATMPLPKRDVQSDPKFMIARSFDVNKPGFTIDQLSGGVVGGTLVKGQFKQDDEVEIRPGLIRMLGDNEFVCHPIRTRIVSLQSDSFTEAATPGGLFGLGTMMDPELTKQDRMIGHVVGKVGSLPSVYSVIKISYTLLSKMYGIAADVEPNFEKDEKLFLTVGTKSCPATVLIKKKKACVLELTSPICADIGDAVVFSKRVSGHWRLLGYGQIKDGEPVTLK